MSEQSPSTDGPPSPRRAAREQFEVRPPSPESRLRTRRRIATIVAGGIAVAVVVLVVLLLVQPDPEPEATPEPVPGETVTAPVPTATVPPVERDTSTAFSAALPSTVLQWAVADQVVAEDVRAAGALEAYALTYTDGDDATGDVTLATAQWRSPEAAAAHLASLGLTGEPVRSEEVLAGGAAVGAMTAYPDVDGSGERVAWTNGATTFVVTAPDGTATTFYDAFGM
ncbi:hypothetical protein [Serinibacter arcticus]|uniref:Uncharacterized protein n=1 Tax=Serinibacter arcticus TaxID=1655435 RepID=A0A4Z1E1B0_9MICO|nr:hypothetical protein [Serinibacter arcticus]TGO05735.1 hypothetical protein SERN_1739 [Serinibacter arcticus]